MVRLMVVGGLISFAIGLTILLSMPLTAGGSIRTISETKTNAFLLFLFLGVVLQLIGLLLIFRNEKLETEIPRGVNRA